MTASQPFTASRSTGRAHRLRLYVLLVVACVVFAVPRQADSALLLCLVCVCTIIDTPATVLGIDTIDFGGLEQGDFGMVEPVLIGDPGQDSGTADMGDYQDWLIKGFFDNNSDTTTTYDVGLGQALMAMTEQMTSVAMMQMHAVGAMFDAQDQLDTQLLFQRLVAQAHKEYQPDDDMCVFGTAARDLAAADANSGLTTDVLARQQQERELEEASTKAGSGPASDRASRLQQFKDRYCDPNDNDAIDGKATTGLGMVCGTSPTSSTVNRDIDYLRTVLLPRTLDVDFSNTTATDDEKDVIALSSNLYSNELFAPIGAGLTKAGPNQQNYMNERALVAKRSVAEESFDALVGMKSAGSATGGTAAQPYLAVLIQQLGLSSNDGDIKLLLGKNPSYLAQLEVLSKLIYLRPAFYTNLYDTPANVKRRGVAMQAIGSMVDRDIFNSQMRSEQILSQLLEIRLGEAQDEVAGKSRTAGQ